MKLQDRSQLEKVARFKSQGDLVTSFYLDTDKGRLNKKEIQGNLKNLLSAARSAAEALDAAREKKDSLTRDLDLIGDFAAQSLATPGAAGLAMFSCRKRDFWIPLELPHGPRNRFVFDSSFYVRPLDAILGRYSRICAVLLGRREARWYEIVMNEIAPVDSLTSDVPSRVREGGFEGYESKRIERHIDAHLQEHFKKAAQTTFDISKKRPFDWLFIGCEDNHVADFESHLHPYMREKIQSRLKSRVSDSPAQVLKEVLEVEGRLKKAEEEATVQRLVAELERGGLAASGLRDTLHRLNIFEVQSLVVTHNFAKPGRLCPSHRFLYVDELKCPVCEKKTDLVQDVVDEAIETILQRAGTVKHITPPSKLDRYGHIGAFLKYKV